MVICAIEGCDKPAGVGKRANRQGWCVMHHARWKRHGDPLAHFGPSPIMAYEVDPETGCWLWTGMVTRQGYGQVKVANHRERAHRWVYEHFVGPIPDGLTLDHTCHNADPTCVGGPTCRHRRCVNPSHLEPVTGGENARRGLTRRTHCRNGHAFADHAYLDGRGRRICRVCRRDRQAAR